MRRKAKDTSKKFDWSYAAKVVLFDLMEDLGVTDYEIMREVIARKGFSPLLRRVDILYLSAPS